MKAKLHACTVLFVSPRPCGRSPYRRLDCGATHRRSSAPPPHPAFCGDRYWLSAFRTCRPAAYGGDRKECMDLRGDRSLRGQAWPPNNAYDQELSQSAGDNNPRRLVAIFMRRPSSGYLPVWSTPVREWPRQAVRQWERPPAVSRSHGRLHQADAGKAAFCTQARASSRARLIQVLMVSTGTPYRSDSCFRLSPRM